MTTKDFDQLFSKFVQLQRDTLTGRSKEYSRNSDRLHNFKRAGLCLNCIPETALLGMASKHLISMLDIVNDVEAGKTVPMALIEEKLVDYANYTILLFALLSERLEPSKTSFPVAEIDSVIKAWLNGSKWKPEVIS